jgi:hypothetical protein
VPWIGAQLTDASHPDNCDRDSPWLKLAAPADSDYIALPPVTGLGLSPSPGGGLYAYNVCRRRIIYDASRLYRTERRVVPWGLPVQVAACQYSPPQRPGDCMQLAASLPCSPHPHTRNGMHTYSPVFIQPATQSLQGLGSSSLYYHRGPRSLGERTASPIQIMRRGQGP